MLTRRELLERAAGLGAVAALAPARLLGDEGGNAGVEVNDVQSQLNATRVERVVTPASLDALQPALREAAREGRAVSVTGGRHAMGGQQFGSDTVLLDMTRFNRVVMFDRAKGHIEVEGGIEWPELIGYLHEAQADESQPWAIREKQTLLACQILIIVLMVKIGLDFSRQADWAYRPRRHAGSMLLAFGATYPALMIIRYVVRMALFPQERWFGGSIPIFFHWVLAAYVLVLGWHHRRNCLEP